MFTNVCKHNTHSINVFNEHLFYVCEDSSKSEKRLCLAWHEIKRDGIKSLMDFTHSGCEVYSLEQLVKVAFDSGSVAGNDKNSNGHCVRINWVLGRHLCYHLIGRFWTTSFLPKLCKRKPSTFQWDFRFQRFKALKALYIKNSWAWFYTCLFFADGLKIYAKGYHQIAWHFTL